MATVVHFIRDFDFIPREDPYITYAYQAGTTVEVPDECADRAVVSGSALFPDFAEDDLYEDGAGAGDDYDLEDED